MIQLIETLRQDLKFALRAMRKNPAFSVAVVLTIALGIGANTAMFSVIRAVLLKPLAFRQPDQIVLFTRGSTPLRFQELSAAAHSYTEVGANAVGFEDMALSGAGQPEALKGARVSANFLRIVGANPILGRGFREEEDKPGAAAVAMLGAELWQRRFAADPSIVGKSIILAGVPHTVVGVLPPGFQFPLSGTDVWVAKPSEWSVIAQASRPLSPILGMFARLKPGVTLDQANAELKVLDEQYAAAHPTMMDAKRDPPSSLEPLRENLVSDIRPKLWMLFGAVSFVLLIVCANIASLLLARATARAREFAVRAAIGAGRGRIITQLLSESVLLSAIGGTLGIALAAVALTAIRGMTFIDLPRAGEIRMDAFILAFGIALALLAGIAFGLLPALAASRPDLAAVLRGSGEAQAGRRSRLFSRFGSRGILVVVQVGLSVILLIGATLLIESLGRLYRVDSGFQSSGLLTMNIAVSPARYDTDQKLAIFYDRLMQRIESVPGVESATVALTLPMDGYFGAAVQVAGRAPLPLNERPIAIFETITPDYFRTLRIPLKRGREFSAHDDGTAKHVSIINEAFARVFWPEYPHGVDPIGQSTLLGPNPQPYEIVGIASDVHQTGRDENPGPQVFVPTAQKPAHAVMLAVRTAGNPPAFAGAVRNAVLEIDPDQPVSNVSTMDELVESSAGQLRLMMRLLGAFAGAATLLAIIGLYGVISYSVVQRTREIGIRRALGAPRGNILSLLLRQGLVLSLSGIVLGVGGAMALTRLLQDLLFQVSPTDIRTFAGVSALFVAVAIAASYIPANRAAEIDPQVALRAE